MRILIITAFSLVVASTSVSAQQSRLPKLSELPPGQHVASINYCDGTYVVTTKDGAKLTFPEFNLRFKTDSGSDGPATGTPALLPSNMMGDRAFVIFSNPEEISASVGRQC